MSASEMVVIIRPSFMKFCQDGCIAAAFNHALYWIAYKAKGQPKEKVQSGEITWYATTEEFTEGLASAWGVCKVRQSVNAMIDMGLIGRGCNTHWKVDRTKHFFFGKDQCKKLLELCEKHEICLLHLGLHTNVLQMINLSNASGTQLQCTCKQMINLSKHLIDLSDGQMDSSDASDEFIETIPKDSTKVTSKDISKERENDSEASQEITPPKETSILSDDQQKFLIDIYYQSKIGKAKPKVDVNLQKHLIRLMELTKTIEELDSLFEYVQKRIIADNLQDQTVYPGNLTSSKYLTGWLQEQERSQKEMDPYVRACMVSSGEIQPTPEEQHQILLAYASQPTINGKINFVASDVKRNTSRERKYRENFITTGPLSGQPDYHADPWA